MYRVVLLPRDHRYGPVQVFHRETVVNTDIRALGAGQEALDPVRVDPFLGLIGLAVVHSPEERQLDKVIIGAVFVGGQERLRLHMVTDGRPSRLRVLVGNYTRNGPVRCIQVMLPDRQDAHPLAVLVFLAAAVDAIFLLVFGLDMAADVFAVDLDGTPELDLCGAFRSPR